MAPIRTPLLALAVAALTACSGGDERPSFNLEIFEAVKANVAERRAPKVERPPLTRAVLNTLDGAFMEAVLERNEQLAYLFVSAARREPAGHTLIIWRSEDNATLTMRNDVLIETKGIGGDLLSTDIAIDPARTGPAGSGLRRMSFMGGANQAIPVSFACEVTDLGPRTITIVEKSHATRLLEEHCTGGGGEIVNQYWIDSAVGLAWQSRQWAGPQIGYIRFRRLTRG